MAAITRTKASVAPSHPEDAKFRTVILAEAVEPGHTLYLTTAGKAGKAQANSAGKEQFYGVAMEAGQIGQAVDALRDGEADGWDVSGLNVGALVYQGDVAGELADAASATKTVVVGKVDVVWRGLVAYKVINFFSKRDGNF